MIYRLKASQNSSEKPAKYLTGYYKKLRFIYFSFLFLIIAGNLPARAQENQADFHIYSKKGFVKIPFEMVQNTILVQVRINNSNPVWCIYDTGAGINVLNEKLAESMDLKDKNSISLNANGGSVGGFVSTGNVISLPNISASGQRIAVVPLDDLPAYFGRDIKGIIGADFIKNFVTEIDYVNKTLTFYDYKTYNLAHEKEAFAMEIRGGLSFINIELSIDEKTKVSDKFELDTGSNESLQINKLFADEHRILSFIPNVKKTEGNGGAGVGGETKSISARLAGLQFGKYFLKTPIASLSQDTKGVGAGKESGLLGTEIFRRFKIILDYQSEKILLKPNIYFNDPFETDMSGLQLIAEKNDLKKIIIKNVKAGFPAAQAGLQEGDELVSINNRRVSEIDKVNKMFRQEGKEYLVTVRRNGKSITARLKMKRAI